MLEYLELAHMHKGEVITLERKRNRGIGPYFTGRRTQPGEIPTANPSVRRREESIGPWLAEASDRSRTLFFYAGIGVAHGSATMWRCWTVGYV